MPILLVPPTGAAGSNVVFLCLLSFFFFLALIRCDFHFISFSSFLLLISLIEGGVWRGCMTSLLCLFRILSDAEGRGIGDKRRTETANRVARYQADY